MADLLLAPFTVKHRGVLRTLTPIHATSAPADAELREASISLFHHVLPGVGRKFMRKLFSNPRAQTILLLQSAEDVLADRRRAAAAAPAEAPPAAADGGGDDDDDADTSSFSGPTDDEAHNDDDDADDDDDDDESGSSESESEGEGSRRSDEPAEAAERDAPVRVKQRVVGAASFEMIDPAQCPSDAPRVLQLTLVGVRTKFQGLGLGSQLLRRALSRRLAGEHDAVLAFADHDAVDFFRKHGFSDDAILTSRYRRVVDAWDQSTLMVKSVVRAPPRAAPGAAGVDDELGPPSTLSEPRYVAGADVRARIDEWREARVDAYSRELAMVEGMAAELRALRQRAVRQDDHLSFLLRENVGLHRELARLRDGGAEPPPRSPPRAAPAPLPAEPSGALSSLLAPLDPASALHARLAAAFAASVSPVGQRGGRLHLRRIWQLASTDAREKRRVRFEAHKRRAARGGAGDGPSTDADLELYLGAPVEVLQHVLINGIDLDLWPPRDEALKDLEVYGEGLYLSRHASKAHQFTAGGRFVLVMAAHLTDTHIAVLPDKARTAPDGESTAIIVPGRRVGGPFSPTRLSAASTSAPAGEEFVIFRERLPPLAPVCMIEYDAESV